VTGRAIAHYEIIEKLGEGGMGVVYKARDTHLDRFVAIKILPEEKLADPKRKQRFIQEAKAASALSHPNIVHIYDIGQADDIEYIAMEFVPGKTLDRVIPRHGLQPGEALRYAAQIADALARAHAAGIVHRDLKPSNVIVSDQGLAKVLDFGLAKLTEQKPDTLVDATRTLRPRMTEEGTVVGTAAYMSPEQAEGKPVDARSDIFSFGCLLYEMLTGRRAFQADTNASTIAAILRDDPKPVTQIVAGLPAELDRIVKRCLRKDPAQRIRHMDDLKLALEELKQESDSGAFGPVARPALKGRSRRLRWAAVGAAALVLAAAGVRLARSRTSSPEPDLVAVPLTTYPGTENSPSFSPDGTQVAFAWCKDAPANTCSIYVKQIGMEPPSRLTDATADCCPAWSPDGRYIAFIRRVLSPRLAVILIPQRGGRERVLAEYDVAQASIFAAPGAEPCAYVAWTPDSKWLAYPEADSKVWPLFLISTETGEKRRLTHPGANDLADSAPAFSPDGRTLAFSRQLNDVFSSDLYLLRLGNGYTPQGEPEKVQSGKPRNIGAAWPADGGELVFSSGTDNSFGLWRMGVPGQARPRRLGFAASGASAPAISVRAGRLAFVVGRQDSNIWRIGVAENGKASSPVEFISSTQADEGPAYSPDGKRIAFLSDRSGATEIWVCESDGSNPVQVTSGGLNPFGARWSWDGRSIAYWVTVEGRAEVYVASANGGASRRLETSPGGGKWPYWSRDGQWIYFVAEKESEGIWKMPSSGGHAVRLTRNDDDVPQESPDEKYLYLMRGWPYQVSIWRMPAGGGEATKILDSVHPFGSWQVGERGIYYFSVADARGRSEIRLYAFATGNTRKIATVERPVVDSITVSPDGRTILYAQFDEAGSDLMLVENFR